MTHDIAKNRQLLVYRRLGNNVGYRVRNHVLRLRSRVTVKRDFRTYIRRYTSPNENFDYGYPHSNPLLQLELKLEHCNPQKATHHPTKFDVINEL